MRQPPGKPLVQTASTHVLALLAVFALGFLTVYRSFEEFGFYADDWVHVQQIAQLGHIETSGSAYPLRAALTELVFEVVGLTPATGYWLLAGMLLASALCVYWMLNVLFPRRRALVILTTTFYVLYPGDLSRTLITEGLTGGRFTVLLALLCLALLFTGFRLRNRTRWAFRSLFIASQLVYLFSLLLHDVQALLIPAMAFAGTAWILTSDRGLVHRSTTRETLRDASITATPYLTVFTGVILWRAVLVATGGQDGLLTDSDLSPVHLVQQATGLLYLNFLGQPFKVLFESLAFLGEIPIVVIAVAVVAALVIVAITIMSPRPVNSVRAKGISMATKPLTADARFYRNLALGSLALTVVAYLVLLPHGQPVSTGGFDGPFVSRLNAAVAFPVVLTAVASGMFLWSWLISAWHHQHSRISITAGLGVTASLVLLVSFHGIVQRDYSEAWNLQQQYANQVVRLMPKPESGSHLHIVGVESRHGASYVFTESTEQMLQLAYDDPTITVSFSTGEGDGYVFARTGLYLENEFVAPAEQVWRLTLKPDTCQSAWEPDCPRLVALAPDGKLVTLSGGVSEESPVLDLLEIDQTEFVAPEIGSNQRFSAPAEPPHVP